jgi:Glycosyl hydrolase family 67 middle domain
MGCLQRGLAMFEKEVLDFDMYVAGHVTRVKDIVASRSFHRPLGGFAGVTNVGLDADWLENPMAMANLYGFARLAGTRTSAPPRSWMNGPGSLWEVPGFYWRALGSWMATLHELCIPYEVRQIRAWVSCCR